MITPARASIRRSSSREVRQDLANIRFLGTEVVNARPELKQWGVGSPAKVPLDELITARGTYDPFKRMRFDAHYPIISGYDRSPAFGYYFHIADPLQFRQFSASLAVSPFDKVHGGERLHVNVEYQTPNWKLTYWHNLADVYDLAGPGAAQPQGQRVHRRLHPAADLRSAAPARRLRLGRGLFRPRPASRRAEHRQPQADLGRPRSASNTPTPPRRLAASIMKRASKARIVAGADQARAILSASSTAGSSVGTALPWSNSSAWLYAHARHRPAGRATARSRLIISARSATTTSMTGRRSGTARWKASPASRSTRSRRASSPGVTGEINLPPIRFAEVGTPAFYLSYIRPAVFAGAMATQAPDGSGHHYADLGAQLDLNFTVALRLPMVFSVGAAAGWADGHYRRTEWLASLKIM